MSVFFSFFCNSEYSPTNVFSFFCFAYKASEGNPDNLLRSRSYNSPKMDHPEESKEMLNLSSATGIREKSNVQTLRKSSIVSNVVPLDIPNGKGSTKFLKS